MTILLPVLASLSLGAQQGSPPTAQANAGAASQTAAQNADEQAEHELAQLLNQARQQNGLKPLAIDSRLRGAARKHSQLMADKHLLSHGLPGEPTVPKRLAATGIRFDRSGENVALDQTVEGAHTGLMNSPPHRANILNPQYNAVGIGIVRQEGNIWVTEDFVRRLEFHTAEEAESMIAQEFEKLRQQSGMPPLKRQPDPRLRSLACRMAQSGDLNAKQVLGSEPGFSVAFTAAEPDQLPSNVTRMAGQRGISRYSVGVCFAASDKYPSGEYWVAMMFH